MAPFPHSVMEATSSTQNPLLPTAANTSSFYSLDDEGLLPQLAWPHDLEGAIAHRRRLTPPWLPPAKDPTISIVAAQQEHYIRVMIQAVFTTSGIQDNSTLKGLSSFIHGHADQVSSLDVEAACRMLFVAVLNRCTTGFRGTLKSNRLLDQRNKPDPIDRAGDCQTRIDNVIKALREWKSVCKEILLSDSKIVHLANAPATVWKDKMVQKRNNGVKKGNTLSDRAAAAAARVDVQADYAGPQSADGDLPPVGRVVGKNRTRSRFKVSKALASGTAEIRPPPQEEAAPPVSTYHSLNGEHEAPFVSDMILPPRLESTPHGLPRMPESPRDPMNMPNYRSAYGSAPLQQGQALTLEEYRETSPAPLGPSFGYSPSLHRSPLEIFATSGLRDSSLLENGEPTQSTSSLGAGLSLIERWNLLGDPDPLNEFSWSSTMQPSGRFGGNQYRIATETFPIDMTVSGHQEFEGGVSGGSRSDATESPRPSYAVETTGKRARSSSIDADSKPEPRRIKRELLYDETNEAVGKVDEES